MRFLTVAVSEADAEILDELARTNGTNTNTMIGLHAKRIAHNARNAAADGIKLLVERGYSAPEIGALLDLTNAQVKHRLRQLGLIARDHRTPRPEGLSA
jgi:hypothetical protein